MRLANVDLETLLTNPSETRGVEYKQWLDLAVDDHKALLAKALIAIANFGGGRVVLGFKSIDHGRLIPCDDEAPHNPAAVYSVERVQNVIGRYASHRFEVTCDFVKRPGSSVVHPVITIPTNIREVVFPTHGSPTGQSLMKGRLYTRVPGPHSETPVTAGDWSEFIGGLIKRRNDDILDLLNRSPVESVEKQGTPKPEPRKRTVHDRMSNVPPPIGAPPPGTPAIEPLEQGEVFVLQNPISDERVARLREAIRDQLNGHMPMFRLFELVGTKTRLNGYDESHVFGITHVSFKGPFVEGAAWGEIRGYPFAQPIDEYLRKQWAELLAVRETAGLLIPRSIDTLKTFVGEARKAIEKRGGRPDLVVILEPDGDDVDRLFMNENSWWNGPTVIRDHDIQNIAHVRGHLSGLPVLQFHQAPVERALVSVVDLTDYELILADSDEKSGDYIDLSVNPITPEEAQEWVLKAPGVRESLYKSKHHEDGAYSTEEAMIRLQLMARYRLHVAGEVRERHRPRTHSAWLDAAVGDEAENQ